MSRVLLFNPVTPGRPVLRDFACGDSTKGDYYWAPIDLLVLSGLLDADHQLTVIDAEVERLSPAEAVRRAAAARPDVVFTLTSAITLASDDRLLGTLKQATGARVYGLGDVASFAPADALAAAPAFDGLVQNFADPSLVRLAAGDSDGVTSVVLRRGDRVDARPVAKADPMRYGLPRHDLFPLHRYRLPFSRTARSSTILTAYGCPFPCTFCNSNLLPWQLRPIDDVAAELTHLRRLGVRDVYLRDFSFGPTRRRAQQLCEAMTAAARDLRWSAECRLETLDPDLLAQMRRAGCDVILVGLETGDADVARQLGKRLDHDRAHRLLAHARRLGLRVCGHFVLGAPGETRDQVQRTLRYAASLPLDYASFNLYAPRLGTPMRQRLVAEGRLAPTDLTGQDVSVHANAFSAVPPDALRHLFVRGVLSFYFRPRQLARLLRCTPWSVLARQGLGVLRGLTSAQA